MRARVDLTRRNLLKAGAGLGGGFLLASCGGVSSTSVPSAAASAGLAVKSLADIEAAAKKETGSLLFYVPGARDLAQALIDGFTKQYSWAKVDTFVGTSSVVANKITTEALMEAPTADVFMLPATFRQSLLDNKVISPVRIEGDQKMPKDLLDADAYGHPGYELLLTLVYNTDSVKTAPKDPFELADPSWSGKIAFDKVQNLAISTIFLCSRRQQWGDKKWLEWLQGLAANKIFITNSGGDSYAAVLKGERTIGIGSSNDVAAQKPGTPVAADYQFPPVPFIQYMWLARRAARPATGQLFLEFVSSEAGQRAVASTGRSPVMDIDVPTNPKRILPSGISVMPGTALTDFYSRTANYMGFLTQLWPA